MNEAIQKLNLIHRNDFKSEEENAKSVLISAEQKEISKLKKQNSILVARLKQAESGISQKEEINKHDDQEKPEVGVYEVERLLDHKMQKNKRLFLVRWKGFDKEHDTWEPESNLNCPAVLHSYIMKNKIQHKTNVSK